MDVELIVQAFAQDSVMAAVLLLVDLAVVLDVQIQQKAAPEEIQVLLDQLTVRQELKVEEIFAQEVVKEHVEGVATLVLTHVLVVMHLHFQAMLMKTVAAIVLVVVTLSVEIYVLAHVILYVLALVQVDAFALVEQHV